MTGRYPPPATQLPMIAENCGMPMALMTALWRKMRPKSSSSGKITLVASPAQPIQDRHLLLVEDIVDTGLTMRWLANHFKTKGAASVRICSLIDKAERREHSIHIDYPGFAISEGFLIGYGLDYDEQYRNLPAIYHLNL